MRIDAILLELDGVIADTSAARRMAFEPAMNALAQHHPMDIDAYREFVAGVPTAEALGAMAAHFNVPLDDTDTELLALQIDRRYADDIENGTVLIHGARAAVKQLAGSTRLAIVSHLRRSDVESLISLARLDAEFTFVLGHEDAFPAKPDPAPYLAAMRRLQRVRPVAPGGAVVVIEHSRAGAQAARAAGLPCVMTGDVPAHVAIEANAYVSSIADLTTDSLIQLLASHGNPDT